jgi:hypothetical protein
MTPSELKKACKRVNDKFYTLGLLYHDGVPVNLIDTLLVDNGFEATEPAIYCGRDGKVHEEVGHGKWLSLTWHKMESDRFEIVAYLN